MNVSIKYLSTLTVAIAALGFTFSNASAGVIGNWDASGRSWNNGSTLVNLMTSRGHTVEANGAISAANLSNDTVFVIGEATRATTVGETTDLLNWITGGGRLLITVDSGGQGVTAGNTILASLGTTLSFAGSAVNGVLQGGNFLTTGGPYDIVGQSLQVTPGKGVTGGSPLAGSFVAFAQIGSGFVFGFGDHFQHNFFNNNASNTNGKMHINLVESASIQQIPEPGSLLIMGLGLAGLGFARRRRLI